MSQTQEIFPLLKYKASSQAYQCTFLSTQSLNEVMDICIQMHLYCCRVLIYSYGSLTHLSNLTVIFLLSILQTPHDCLAKPFLILIKNKLIYRIALSVWKIQKLDPFQTYQSVQPSPTCNLTPRLLFKYIGYNKAYNLSLHRATMK